MAQAKVEYPLDYTKGPDLSDQQSRLEQAADAAADRVNKLSDGAMDTANKVMQQARQYGEQVQDAAKNFKPYVERSLKDQPMSTLAAAAAIGFLLGAVWKK